MDSRLIFGFGERVRVCDYARKGSRDAGWQADRPAEDDCVIVHSRYSGNGRPSAWVVIDIVRMQSSILAEHWDVIQDEATEADSKSGKPMFGVAGLATLDYGCAC